MLSQIADAREVGVIRNGAKASVYIPEDLMQRLLADSISLLASHRFPVCDRQCDGEFLLPHKQASNQATALSP